MARRENAREKILEAAEALVIEKGVDALTMDTIAMITGLGKGGVLYHFGYKVDLIKGLLDRHLERWGEAIQLDAEELEGDIYGWLEHLINFSFEEKGELHRSGIEIFAAASRYPQLLGPVEQFFQRRRELILKYVDDPALAAMLMLAADGFGFFCSLSLTPIADSEINPVRERLLGMVAEMREAAKD